MPARRSRSRSGAAGERGGGQARLSDPASPLARAPALRRSQRKSGSEPPEAPPQPPPPAPRTAITLRKIVAPAAEVTLLKKENSPLRQESSPFNQGSSPPTTSPALEVTTTVLRPLTPNAIPRPDLMDARDLEMSRKVRRSYSRLGDVALSSGSTSTPNYRRCSFFGFERLLSGEELENVSPVVKESKNQAVAPMAEPWGPDSSLPGITITKEKRRKRRVVPEILKSELDEWAAAMNAQFEAAEKFDLLVE